MRKKVGAQGGSLCSGLKQMLSNGHPNQADSSRLAKELDEQVCYLQGCWVDACEVLCGIMFN